MNTVNTPVAELDMAQVQAILNAQVAEGKALIEAERVAVEETIILHSADMQFQGQSHLLSIALASSQVSREMLQSAFERAYWDRFEVELPAIRPVLVNLHTAVLGRRKSVDPRELLPADERVDSLAQARLGTRPVWFQGGWHETPLYRREHLPLASQLQGPAIVEQLDTTIVVPPDCQMSIDELGNLLLRMG